MTKNARFPPKSVSPGDSYGSESQDEYDSQWAAICSIAPKKIGCTPRLRVSYSA